MLMLVLLEIKQQASKADMYIELVKLMHAKTWHNFKPWDIAANQNNVDRMHPCPPANGSCPLAAGDRYAL